MVVVTFDAGGVEVGVEHDDGEGEDEDGVGILEALQHCRIALAVALAEDFHEPLDLLRLARHAEVRLELALQHQIQSIQCSIIN